MACIGGRARGEVASAEAAEYVWEWVQREEPLLREAITESAPAPGGAASITDDAKRVRNVRA